MCEASHDVVVLVPAEDEGAVASGREVFADAVPASIEPVAGPCAAGAIVGQHAETPLAVHVDGGILGRMNQDVRLAEAGHAVGADGIGGSRGYILVALERAGKGEGLAFSVFADVLPLARRARLLGGPEA